MHLSKTAAAFLIVIGASGLVMIILYATGLYAITFSFLAAVVNGLLIIGLILAGAFLRKSIPLRPIPLSLSVIAYVLATVSFIYSSFYGQQWGAFLLGTFFTFLGAAGTLACFRIGTPSAIAGKNIEMKKTGYSVNRLRLWGLFIGAGFPLGIASAVSIASGNRELIWILLMEVGFGLGVASLVGLSMERKESKR